VVTNDAEFLAEHIGSRSTPYRVLAEVGALDNSFYQVFGVKEVRPLKPWTSGYYAMAGPSEPAILFVRACPRAATSGCSHDFGACLVPLLFRSPAQYQATPGHVTTPRKGGVSRENEHFCS
jgi:hypothetical protein